MMKWCDVYDNTNSLPSGFEIHTAKQESDTQNTPRSVSAMLQWTKHNSDGQGWLKRGSREADV